MSNEEKVEEGVEPGEPEEVEDGIEDGVEEGGEQGAETSEPSPKKPANEMKVVIIMKDDKMMLGVQSPDCDPVYTTMQGTLAEALGRVPALVAEAKLKWEASPRYPKADLPEPPPSPTPARRPPTPEPAKSKIRPSMF